MFKKLLLILICAFSIGCSKENNSSSSSNSFPTSNSIPSNSSSSSITSTDTHISFSTPSVSTSSSVESSSTSSEIKEIKYRILLIAGHGNNDPGAVYQNRKEANYNQEFINKLIKELNKYDHPIEIFVEPSPLKAAQEAELISKLNIDFALSIHFNAGGGKGSEMIVPFYEKNFSFAFNFFDKLQNNNFLVRETSVYSKSNSKKIKRNKTDKSYNYDDYFAVIRAGSKKKIPSFILEVEFIDNLSQMKIYDERKDIYISLLAQSIIDHYN